MRINPITNMPYQIPACASAHFNMRLRPIQKLAIKKLSKQQKITMSKKVLEIFDFYFTHAVPDEFWNDPGLHVREKNSKDSLETLQKVLDLLKQV
jgi:hypothetical protein